ncbi:MAG: hypothetical protein Q9191_004964, partial [Dirinaria sp. TL-2023a]
MQRRNKVGGLRDRRFGENDPTMTPEERNLQRFMREKQREEKKASLFNLEDDELTHFGQSLASRGSGEMEDFNEGDLGLSDASSGLPEDEGRPRKRQRLSDDEDTSQGSGSGEDEAGHPARLKTRNEVMKEVIAKSKLHKYERQQAKEDDDDLRAELDKGLPDLFAMLRREKKRPLPQQEPPATNGYMNPDRLALLNGKDRSQADREYDQRLKEFTLDQRSKPTMRTMTEEEKLEQEAQKLKQLEEKRLKRMRGEPESEEENGKDGGRILTDGEEDLSEEENFGLGAGIPSERRTKDLDVEDEDDFVIEDDLIASGSELDISDMEESIEDSKPSTDEEDLEFVQGLISNDDGNRPDFRPMSVEPTKTTDLSSDLPYTFPCPQTHTEFLAITASHAVTNLPIIVQRIRALYQPALSAANKSKLAAFSTILVEHIHYLVNQPTHPPFSVVEALIRHTHSLAKTYPSEISRAFRDHLRSIQETRALGLNPGDLIILTAIGTIFPTSDHFHQVVTPAMLSIARYLAHKIPQKLSDLATGTYLCILCLQYQRLAKRYIPEVVNYTLNTLYALVPSPKSQEKNQENSCYPQHNLPASLALPLNPAKKRKSTPEHEPPKFDFWDILPNNNLPDSSNLALKHSLLRTHLRLIPHMATLWASKPSLPELLTPLATAISHLISHNILPTTHTHPLLKTLLTQTHTSLASRRPLALHNHRPLPIKTSIPKFEESYNPLSHSYDPDRQRSELGKLKAAHKKERKGAVRELRKDANFMARQA